MFKSKSGQTSLRKILSEKSDLKWAKWQWEKQFSSTWNCLILLFIVAFKTVLLSVIFCLLSSCINHPGTSLSVWMHFFSKLSDKCGCKIMAQERGYAWKCWSQPHTVMVLLGISLIRIAVHGDFQIWNVKQTFIEGALVVHLKQLLFFQMLYLLSLWWFWWCMWLRCPVSSGTCCAIFKEGFHRRKDTVQHCKFGKEVGSSLSTSFPYSPLGETIFHWFLQQLPTPLFYRLYSA